MSTLWGYEGKPYTFEFFAKSADLSLLTTKFEEKLESGNNQYYLIDDHGKNSCCRYGDKPGGNDISDNTKIERCDSPCKTDTDDRAHHGMGGRDGHPQLGEDQHK